MLPDLNRLRVFFHIYNSQSSTAAAGQLHITQSGVSQHLKKLEEELGTKLFTRVNRKLIPTSAGHRLYGIVQNFLEELEIGVRHINESKDIPTGILRIGAPTEFGRTYMPGIFASFYKKYPQVTFQLELHEPKVLFSMISEGSLDFAYIDILPFIIDTPGGNASYSITPVLKEEFVLACSQKYYESRVIGADYNRITKLNFIGYKTDISLFKSWFKLHYQQQPQSLNMVLTADSSGAIVKAIEEDMGLGITVSHLINRQITSGKIVAIRPTKGKLQNTIACVQFREKKINITESEFQKHFREELNKNYAKLDLCD